MTDFINDLRQRGLIHDITPGTEAQLQKEMTAGYIGFDPTADSLHVGSLLQITLLLRLQNAGHKPFALLGGATGMVGDPSGKSAERNLLDEETLQKNIDGVEKQLRKFLNFDVSVPNAAVLVNNYTWFKGYEFLRFIRDIGKHITVNYMMAKDSVQKRLEGGGMSFTEFSYQLIQGYDYYHLYETYNVKLQMGGSDQWGNVLTGTELIRKKNGGEAYALVSPLITKSDGSKFGKTEQGNIWLDPKRTSPYRFYQYWLKLSDEDAIRMAYIFSFKSIEELNALVEEHKLAPHLRTLQKMLAEELTVLVHSREDYQFALQASEILYGKNTFDALKQLNEQQLLEVLEGVPQVNTTIDSVNAGIDIISFLFDTGIMPSKGEAKRLLQNNGISINKAKVGATHTVTSADLLNNRYILLQKGKEFVLAIAE
ncbi:MAG: tyrosine--tRNA ligase [Chitinophagia bacterium]|nr:tyrosine--tRNA ligase [Chitinophagia bacterium]